MFAMPLASFSLSSWVNAPLVCWKTYLGMVKGEVDKVACIVWLKVVGSRAGGISISNGLGFTHIYTCIKYTCSVQYTVPRGLRV